MNNGDMLGLAIIGRAVLDRQEREQQEAADRIVYSNQVAGLLAQGYSLEQAHSQVQDFYERQAALQAQIAADQAPTTSWFAVCLWLFVGFAALCFIIGQF